MKSLGISRKHREILSKLHRQFSGPFNINEATDVLEKDRKRVNRLLIYWASRGWLSRIKRGVYITVPLDALHPAEWKEDTLVVAEKLFHPCYIGGWSAAEHWHLTEQIFSEIVVFTLSPVRERIQTFKGMKYRLSVVSPEKMFGLKTVWRENIRISISDPTRTVVDMLDNPRTGGGIRHIADILVTYFESEYRDDNQLLEYILKLKNRTICKRLGYMLEHLSIDAPKVTCVCKRHISTGYSKLDPDAARRGRLIRKWNLEINVALQAK